MQISEHKSLVEPKRIDDAENVDDGHSEFWARTGQRYHDKEQIIDDVVFYSDQAKPDRLRQNPIAEEPAPDHYAIQWLQPRRRDGWQSFTATRQIINVDRQCWQGRYSIAGECSPFRRQA